MAESSPDEEVNKPESTEGSTAESPIPRDWEVDSDVTDDGEDDENKVSMFCRNCLSPYVGEKSIGGQIILKCKKCSHRDVITDVTTQLPDKDGEKLLVGDLISNKFNRILNFEKVLKQIDVTDPNNIPDDFKRIHALHSPVLKCITKTTNEIRHIVNQYRMEHNMVVYTKVKSIKDQLETNTGIATKVDMKEKPRAYYVEITGSVERSNFILDPKTFAIPEYVLTNVKIRGSEGIRNVDKLLLEMGLPNRFIKQSMPLYQKRLGYYRRNIPCRFKDRDRCTCASRKSAHTGPKLFRISDDDILSEDLSDVLVEMPATDSIISRRKRRRREKLKNANVITLDELRSMLDCLVKTEEVSSDTESQNEDSKKTKTDEDFVIPYPEILNFRVHLGVTDFAGDYEEQKFLLEHMEYVPYDIHDFSTEKVNNIFLEIIDGVAKRQSDAREERRLRTITFLKETSAKMCEKVDDIRDEIINELRSAYRAKMIRSNKQKKLLLQRKNKMLEYRELLRQCQEEGDLQRLQQILNEVNEWQNEN